MVSGYLLSYCMLILAIQISAGLECPQGCEVCDIELGCLKSSKTSISLIELGFGCQDLCTTCDSVCPVCKKNSSTDLLGVCVCEAGFFKTGSQCSRCSPLCKICDHSSGCSECKANAGSDPTDCSCISGYREDNGACHKCTDSICDKCALGAGEEVCSRCKSFAKVEGESCVCIEGYYKTSSDTCEECSIDYCIDCPDDV